MKTTFDYRQFIVHLPQKRAKMTGKEAFEHLKKLIFSGPKTDSVKLIRKDRGGYED